MDSTTIKNIIGYKKDRIEILKTKQKTLSTLGQELSVSKFKQSFRIVYFGFKSILLYAFIFITFLMAIIALVTPNVLFFNKESYKTTVALNFEDEYKNFSNKSLLESFSEVQQNKAYKIGVLEENINKSVENTTVSSIENTIRLSAVLLIAIGILLLYIKRQNKIIAERDQIILKTKGIVEDIIDDYEMNIEEEQREINELQRELNS